MCNSFKNTKIIDKRLTYNGRVIRRRRECKVCGERFSTYEIYVELGSGNNRSLKNKDKIIKYLMEVL